MDKKSVLAELAGLPVADALDRILAAMDAETGTVHVVGPDGLLHLTRHAGAIPQQLLPVIRCIPIGKGMAGLAAERKEPVQICNLQTDSTGDARPGARSTGMRGSICVPMEDEDRLVGVLGVAVMRERDFTAEETDWLSRAGAVLASALERL